MQDYILLYLPAAAVTCVLLLHLPLSLKCEIESSIKTNSKQKQRKVLFLVVS